MNKILTILLLCAGLQGFGQKNGLLILTLTLDGPASPDSPASAFSIEPAALKYNKDFAWSFTLDDGYVSAFLVAFPYFNGGRVAAPYIDQWGHDQGGDGLTYPGLFFTDGCGNRVSFRAGLAINARSVADTPAAGVERGDHPGHLSWQQVSDMYHTGWDIFNHGYAHATGGAVDAGSEVRRNNQAVAEHLGFRMSQFVVPGGKDDSLSQEPYAQAAFEQGMAAVHCGRFPQHWVLPEGGGLPDRDGKLDHLRAGRLFVSSRTLRDSGSAVLNDTAFFDGLPGLLSAGKKAWINVFTHGVGNDDLWGISLRFPDFKALFAKLAARYGAEGRDNIWMASFQAVQEYLLIRQSMQYQVRQEGHTVVVTIDTAHIPAGLRHKTMTFCWKSRTSLREVSCQGCTVESFSRSGSPQLVNIGW